MPRHFDIKSLLESGTSQEALSFLKFCYENNENPNNTSLRKWNTYNDHQELLMKLASELYQDCDDVYQLLRLADEAAKDTVDFDNYPSSAKELNIWITNKLSRIRAGEI